MTILQNFIKISSKHLRIGYKINGLKIYRSRIPLHHMKDLSVTTDSDGVYIRIEAPYAADLSVSTGFPHFTTAERAIKSLNEILVVAYSDMNDLSEGAT